MDSPKPQSILLVRTNVEKITSLINKMQDKKASGYDSINAKFLKLTSAYIAPIICDIFNSMIKTGMYPDELK